MNPTPEERAAFKRAEYRRMWSTFTPRIDPDYLGSALAHEGVELPADVLERIAGDLNAWLYNKAANGK